MDEIVMVRQQVVEYLQNELLGPHSGEHEILTEEPYKRYTTGILYPRESKITIQQDEDEDEVAGPTGNSQLEEQADDPLVLANQYLPGSMGLSFYLSGSPQFSVTVTGAQYIETNPAKGQKNWRRQPRTTSLDFPIPGYAPDKQEQGIFQDAAKINVIWRPSKNGWLVTVTIINNKTGKNASPTDPRDCLYQLELRCKPGPNAKITAYPRVNMVTDDKEEYFLELLYRHQNAYGVGHGCSVDWATPVQGGTTEIRTDMLPKQEVLPMNYDLQGDNIVLNLYFLQSEGHIRNPHTLISKLEDFVEKYRLWIEQLPSENVDIPPYLHDARDQLLDRLKHAQDRMRDGIKLLETDKTILLAFCLANRAMLMQMLHTTPEYSGTRHTFEQARYQEPDLTTVKDRGWRPFQLAFQLLTLSSIVNPDDAFRQTVDLIWFPTGGGKTEAYLFVSAFLIFYRRLRYKSEADGTTILMRYTLRLLTTQQFRRAAALICACEQLRRKDPEILGSSEISIGLWVGNDTTPNQYKDAHEKHESLLKEDEPINPFQMDRCPWCGTELIPTKLNMNQASYGIRSSLRSFQLFCPHNACPFHEKLPIGIVDQQLYDQPPTLLLATVDKFARMPWHERVASFFGGENRRPPDLIIQDELHLISGPLGTIVGVYETAIDALVSWNGTPSKIIASTATIRRADDQCKGLYARDVSLFPPSGLDASDSYFAKYDTTKPGRLYIGVLGAAHTASTTMIRTSATLLQAPTDLQLQGKALDAYWTLVAYHNSLRELGKSRTFGADDIPARIKVIAYSDKNVRELKDDNIQELTSNINAARLGEMLHKLEYPANHIDEVSFLLCTNMLSVGVDVSRLGVMLVNGQPKSTSEYIQATSRVGRSSIPGLVVCVYSPSKPRDRSHYERFKAYHSSLYRHVEPTSVTPFAPPARDRALHAVLVSLIRYKTSISNRDDARYFPGIADSIDNIINVILKRVKLVDPREIEQTEKQIQKLIQNWKTWAIENPTLSYDSQHPSKPALLFNMGDSRAIGWPTLQSMRNVDQSCRINIMRSR